jgi:hypothetical protein
MEACSSCRSRPLIEVPPVIFKGPKYKNKPLFSDHKLVLNICEYCDGDARDLIVREISRKQLR